MSEKAKEILEKAVISHMIKCDKFPENRVVLDEHLYNQALAALNEPVEAGEFVKKVKNVMEFAPLTKDAKIELSDKYKELALEACGIINQRDETIDRLEAENKTQAERIKHLEQALKEQK